MHFIWQNYGTIYSICKNAKNESATRTSYKIYDV